MLCWLLLFCLLYVLGVNGDILPLQSTPIKLIQLKTKGGVAVFCSDISKDASLLAYSDCDSIRIYKLFMVSTEGLSLTSVCSSDNMLYRKCFVQVFVGRQHDSQAC